MTRSYRPTGRPAGRPATPVVDFALRIAGECLEDQDVYHRYDFDNGAPTPKENADARRYILAAARSIDPKLVIKYRLGTDGIKEFCEIRVHYPRKYGAHGDTRANDAAQ